MKPMIKLTRSGNDSFDDSEIWIDPYQIASVVSNKDDGSIVTLIQKNFFKVRERSGEVIGRAISAKRLNEETFGNE